MKVSSTPPSSAHAASGSAKPAAGGFSAFMSGANAAAPAAPAAATQSAGSVSGVSALLMLQSVGGPEGRARALKKGRNLLNALDRLQLSLLGKGPTAGDLQRLKSALAEERGPSGDSELDHTLDWAEVRAAVEAAKLERAVPA
jgi:hypothetical protein